MGGRILGVLGCGERCRDVDAAGQVAQDRVVGELPVGAAGQLQLQSAGGGLLQQLRVEVGAPAGSGHDDDVEPCPGGTGGWHDQ